ncbi:MAG: TetR/AcrR family transcriptional regulator [Fischerella sp. CENA71]|nr:TetR/AcrR family transcriptional regulator [Fischerella sp. CENA71]
MSSDLFKIIKDCISLRNGIGDVQFQLVVDTLAATWELLKTTTLRDLSIEAIARESGVGKTTIYRWWPSKVAVVMDAFVENVLSVTPFPEGLSATEAIKVQMASLVQTFSGDYGRIVAQIIAEG